MNLTEMCKILGTNKEEITGAKRDKDICFNRHLKRKTQEIPEVFSFCG